MRRWAAVVLGVVVAGAGGWSALRALRPAGAWTAERLGSPPKGEEPWWTDDDHPVSWRQPGVGRTTLMLDGRAVGSWDGLDGRPVCFTGGPVVWQARTGPRRQLVVDGVAGPWFDELSLDFPVTRGADGRLAYAVRQGRKWWLVCGADRAGPFDQAPHRMGRATRDRDGDAEYRCGTMLHIVCRAVRGGRTVLLADLREVGWFEQVGEAKCSEGTPHWACFVWQGERRGVVHDGRLLGWHRGQPFHPPTSDDCCCSEGENRPFTDDEVQHVAWAELGDDGRARLVVDGQPRARPQRDRMWDGQVSPDGALVTCYTEADDLLLNGDNGSWAGTPAERQSANWAVARRLDGAHYWLTPQGTTRGYLGYEDPVWDPGHRHVALRGVTPDGRCDVWRDGVLLQSLPSRPELAFDGSGRHLIARYTDQAEATARVMTSVDGRVLPSGLLGRPAFCADGAHLAYVEQDRRGRQRVVIDGRPQPWSVAATCPTFSPDGQRLAYHRSTGSLDPLAWVRRRPTELPVDGAFVFSPDGRRTAYVRRCGDHQSAMVVDGREGEPFVEIRSGPVFSADGRHVVYAARRAGANHLVCDGVVSPAYDDALTAGVFAPDGTYRRVVRRGRELVRLVWHPRVR